jgi:hypothetical protein
VNAAIAELYFLTQLTAPRRELTLTTKQFYGIFTRALAQKVADGLIVRHIPLPAELQAEVSRVQRGKQVSRSRPYWTRPRRRRLERSSSRAGERRGRSCLSRGACIDTGSDCVQ